MKFQNIDYEKEGKVSIVTINHAPANAWDLQTMSSFGKVLDDIQRDENTRAVIITGAGDRFFSAGLDVKDVENKWIVGPMGRYFWMKVEQLEKPTIAAINGHTNGGGLELALACHFRIMEKQSKGRLGLTELNVGIIPGWGGTQRLKKLIGNSKALELILFSKTLSAEQAFEMGLISSLTDPGTLMPKALEMAHTLSKRPPLAVKWTLKAMLAGDYEGTYGGYHAEVIGSEVVGNSADCKEGFQAFAEKRNPVFKGI